MSPGIVELSPNTYRLSRVDGGGVFADAAAMKASVVDEANAFAQRKGKIAVPIATREERMKVGRLSTVEYDFRLVSPGEMTAKPAEAMRRPDVTTAETAPARPADQPPPKPDLYGELIKLDDLRQRGILTEQEFQKLKTRLIDGK